MKKNANKGFSLVELIIVIAIMAVLIGVLAPQFIKQVERSKESTDLQNIEEYKTAVETAVAEEAITGTGEVTITVNVDDMTISCDKDLSAYGLPAAAGTKQLKSSKWLGGSGSFDIKYSITGFSWTYPSTLPEATYFKADGTSK